MMKKLGRGSVILLFAFLAAPIGGVAAAPPAGDTELDAATFYSPSMPPERGRGRWRMPSVEVAQLMRARDYDGIERMAAEWRSKKLRDDDGMWMLRQLYDAVSNPKMPSVESWKAYLDRLDEWRAQKPKSVTAWIASAEAWTVYGWFAADGPDGRQVFTERHQKAQALLEEAEKFPERCPEIYAAWHLVAIGLGWPRDRYEAMYQKAIAFEPTYYDYYLSHAYYLLPRWGGQPGEWQKYALDVAEKTKEREGTSLYARIVLHIWTREEKNPFTQLGVDWPKTRQGFTDLLARCPKSQWFLNAYALMAYMAKDAPTAAPLIARIGDGFEPHLWGNAQYYDGARTWSSGSATPEGAEWQKDVDDAHQAFAKHDFDTAEKALRAAAKLSDRFPETDRRRGATLEEFGMLALLESDFPKAREQFGLAIAAYEKTHFVAEPGFARALGQLAFAEGAVGDWNASAATDQRIIELLDRRPPSGDAQILKQTLVNWMQALRQAGRNDEATVVQKRLETPSSSGGVDTASAEAAHERAAREAIAAGHLDDAEKETRIAMKLLATQPLGKKEAMQLLGNFASVCNMAGQSDRALALAHEATKLAVDTLGPENVDTADAMLREASFDDVQNHRKEARDLIEHALAILDKTAGPDDPRTIHAQSALARHEIAGGDAAKAESMLKQSLERVDKPGQKGMTIVAALQPLENFYISQSRWKDVEPLVRRELSLIEAETDGSNRIYNEPTVCARLGQVLAAEGKYDEAESYYRQGVESIEASTGPDHLNVAGQLVTFGDFLTSRGKNDEAEKNFGRAAAIYEKAGAGAREGLVNALEHQAAVLGRLGRTAEANAVTAHAKSVRQSIQSSPAVP